MNTGPRVALISLYGVENIGIRILASVLKRQGARVRLYFFKKWKNNSVRMPAAREIGLLTESLRPFDPAVIGIGFGSPYADIARRLTVEIRAAVSSMIVWGGVHPTVCPEDCIEHADAVCIGEGEYPLAELVAAVGQRRPYDDIPNLWVRNGHRVKKNPLRPLMEDLDGLPYPDYGTTGKYFIDDGRCFEEEPLARSAELRVCASRGCPFNCSYCHTSALRTIYEGKGRYFRQHSVAYVIGLLTYAVRSLHLRRIKFDDDTFMSDPAWVREFARSYRAAVGIPFEALAHPVFLKQGPVEDLKAAGLVKLQVGIESASEKESRNVFNRVPCLDAVLAFSRLNKRLRIETGYDIIMDDPLAGFQDKKDILFFLLRLERPFDITMFSLTVFPKTALAGLLLAKNLITTDDIEGRACKSLRQYRVSFDRRRSDEDRFFISLISLTSKNFVPRALIRVFFNSGYLRRHPLLLECFSQAVNACKVMVIAWKTALRGEFTAMKFGEYSNLGKMLIQ